MRLAAVLAGSIALCGALGQGAAPEKVDLLDVVQLKANRIVLVQGDRILGEIGSVRGGFSDTDILGLMLRDEQGEQALCAGLESHGANMLSIGGEGCALVSIDGYAEWWLSDFRIGCADGPLFEVKRLDAGQGAYDLLERR